MKTTRFIAYTIIVASVGLVTSPTGIGSVHARSLRDVSTPAEFPPASFKGRQYVDSKGCIFIRAGIDGNVTWVPRVSRKRQQICGYKPSLTAAEIARAPSAPPSSAAAPVQITVAPSASAQARPTPVSPPAKPRTSKTAPAPAAPVASTAAVAEVSAPAKPATRTQRAAPQPLVFVNPPPERVAAAAAPVAPKQSSTNNRSAPRPAPVPLVFVNPPPEPTATVSVPARPVTTTSRTTKRSAPRPEPQPLIFVNTPKVPTPDTTNTTVSTATSQTAKPQAACPGASPLSQRYINANTRHPVRCGPQVELPVTEYRRPVSEQSSAVDPTTRIVPRHVYEKRQITTNVQIANGNQNVATGKRSTSLAVTRQVVLAPPPGYKPAWDDGRLNPERATGTVAGEAQSNQIWTQTVPRKLIVPAVPDSKQVLVLSSRNTETAISRTSSRSASTSTQIVDKPKYVKVATYETDAGARKAAQNLAQSGLPMRLGTVSRKGKAYRVVLAGPFTSADQVNAALAKVRGAGFSNARISK